MPASLAAHCKVTIRALCQAHACLSHLTTARCAPAAVSRPAAPAPTLASRLLESPSKPAADAKLASVSGSGVKSTSGCCRTSIFEKSDFNLSTDFTTFKRAGRHKKYRGDVMCCDAMRFDATAGSGERKHTHTQTAWRTRVKSTPPLEPPISTRLYEAQEPARRHAALFSRRHLHTTRCSRLTREHGLVCPRAQQSWTAQNGLHAGRAIYAMPDLTLQDYFRAPSPFFAYYRTQACPMPQTSQNVHDTQADSITYDRGVFSDYINSAFIALLRLRTQWTHILLRTRASITLA